MKTEDKGKGKLEYTRVKAINGNTGIAMRVLVMTAILVMLCLFSVQSVSAVQVSENVKFQTPGTNTTFIMGSDFTFDTIEVHSTELRLNDAVISVCPSAGSIDFTLFSFSTEYRKWTESCSNPDAIADHTMGGLKPNTPYDVKVNGAIYGQYRSNDSGYVFFTYSGGYSDIVFEMEEAGAPPKFIAHFMTPEGEPYPFDVIISDGVWRKEFKSVTYIETEVPTDFTCQVSYEWGEYIFTIRPILNIGKGEIGRYQFLAYDPENIVKREKIYVAYREYGANETIEYEWNEDALTLNVTMSGTLGKEVGLYGISGGFSNIHATKSLYVCNRMVGAAKERCFTGTYTNDGTEYEGHFHVRPVNKQTPQVVTVEYAKIDGNTNGLVGVYDFYYNDAIVDNSKKFCQNTTLYNVESGKTIHARYYYPQFAAPGGNYILQTPENIPEDYFAPNLPIQVSNGYGQVPSVYLTKINELSPYTFNVCAEWAFADSSFSNLQYDPEEKTLSVDVSTEWDYVDWWGYFVLPDTVTVAAARSYDGMAWHDLDELYDYTINPVDGYKIVVVRISPTVERLSLKYVDPWTEINDELDALIEKVNNATMPNIIKRRLVDKLEYAEKLKENAKVEFHAGNIEGAKKKLGVAKNQVESFASMVKITRRISEADKEEFLRESALIIGKIDTLIESL